MGVPIHVQPVNKAEAVFGPQPPGLAPLTAGEIPPPAALDPQLRAAAFSESLSPVSQDPQLRGPTSGPTSPGVGPGDREHAKARIYDKIFRLAREIASARAYVGYVFFVILGVMRKCKPFMWEGNSRVNLVDTFAPWALDSAVAECAVDGVVCCMRSLPNGTAEMVPASDDYPLHACRHFLACHSLPSELESEGDSIQAFYGRLGVVLLGTVMDGDCGVDTACMMLGLAQTVENRQALRTEVAAYISDRYDVPWLHDLLVVTAELNIEDVEQFRSSGSQPISIDLTDSSLPVAKTTSSAVAEPVNAAEAEPKKGRSGGTGKDHIIPCGGASVRWGG